MKNVETMVSKVTARINEVDEWYEDKQQHILGEVGFNSFKEFKWNCSIF